MLVKCESKSIGIFSEHFIGPKKKIMRRHSAFALIAGIVISGMSCKDKGTNPGDPVSSGKYSLCYVKLIDDNWEVVIRDDGIVKNISNSATEDNYPVLSPNGNYIAYTHGGTDIFLYDVQNGTSFNITPGIDYFASLPSWLDDSKIIYVHRGTDGANKTYIMDMIGTNNRQILNCSAKIYFCSNENDFIYNPKDVGRTDMNIIYKTNLNASYNEAILDLDAIGEEYTGLYGYDPYREKLLLLVAQTPRIRNIIAEYDVNTKTLDTISVAESGYVYLEPQYSTDYTKIAAHTRNYDTNVSQIVLFKNKRKEVL